MANLENIIEQKIKDNRQIHDALVRKVKEDKEEVSKLILQISNSNHIKIIINKLISMSCDIQTIDSLDSKYYELQDMQI